MVLFIVHVHVCHVSLYKFKSTNNDCEGVFEMSSL